MMKQNLGPPATCREFTTKSSMCMAIPENRGIQKMEIEFFFLSVENNSMSTSFGKKLGTLQATTKMSKLIDKMHVFDGKN